MNKTTNNNIEAIKAYIKVYIGTNTCITDDIIKELIEKYSIDVRTFNDCVSEVVKNHRLEVANAIACAYVGKDEMVGRFARFNEFKYKATTFKVCSWFDAGCVRFIVRMGDDKNMSQPIEFKIDNDDWNDSKAAICVCPSMAD